MICPTCGREYPAGLKFCPADARPLVPSANAQGAARRRPRVSGVQAFVRRRQAVLPLRRRGAGAGDRADGRAPDAARRRPARAGARAGQDLSALLEAVRERGDVLRARRLGAGSDQLSHRRTVPVLVVVLVAVRDPAARIPRAMSWNSLRAFVVLAASSLAAACRRSAPEAPVPARTAPGTLEVLKDGRWLFTYIEPNGQFATTDKPEVIPAPSRAVVRVFDPSKPRRKTPRAPTSTSRTSTRC